MTLFPGITITVERGPAVDVYGDPIAGTPESFTVSGCAVSPRGPDEIDARGRAGVIVGLTLYAPAGSGIQRTDRIIISDGDPNAGTYEVEGDPGEWVSPFTAWSAGIQVALRRTAG